MTKASVFKVLPVALLLLAVGPAAAEEAGYAGSDTCMACHEDQFQSLIHHGSSRSDPACESCHGPGLAHAEAGGDASKIARMAEMTPQEQSATCLDCHTQANARYWFGSAHEQNEVGCTSCHAVHRGEGPSKSLLKDPDVMETCFGCHNMKRVQTMRSSHMPLREGKITCVNCHNPHGAPAEAMLVDNSINDNCYRCHAEKRGPTLFEHPPVRENCLNCHNAHGSMHEVLLVSKQPRLCQNCHINSRHPSEPRTASSRFVFNKSCINCHPQVHGSNHPSGIRMQR